MDIIKEKLQNANAKHEKNKRKDEKDMKNKKYTSQKGITLIALIITIIVMLILVGVTVNVALTGGLFTKATEASKQMQVEAEKEELLSSVVAAIGYDGKVDLGEIQLPNGWTGTNGTYTSPKGNTYTVDENGKIESGESKPVEPPTLELIQISKGKYSDRTTVGLNIKFDNFEQLYSIMGEYYKNIKEEDMPDDLDGYLLWIYNENFETNYGRVEETGMTIEEMVESFFIDDGEDWENHSTDLAFMMNENITFNVKRPDNTTSNFECDGYYDSGDPLEGVYMCDQAEVNCSGYFYSATQTGTYEISTTIGGYTISDTITIEEF